MTYRQDGCWLGVETSATDLHTGEGAGGMEAAGGALTGNVGEAQGNNAGNS